MYNPYLDNRTAVMQQMGIPQMGFQQQSQQYNPYMQGTAHQPVAQQLPMQAMAPPQQIANTGIGLSFNALTKGQSMPVLPVVTEAEYKKPAKKKSSKKKEHSEPINHAEEVNQVIYADTYYDTNLMLRQVINEVDNVTSELRPELSRIVNSKTMSSKYKSISDMASSIGSLVSTKVNAIKELNNSIKAINDMEYKRAKDNRVFESQNNDDKAIMDMYNAFIQAPVSANVPSTGAYSLLGPNVIDATLGMNSQIPMFDYQTQAVNDEEAGYQRYLQNLSPEQNGMLMEGNPDVREVVMYDATTGAKAFKIMNIKTMQEVPNMTAKDPMFLDDTSIDMRNKVARNTNLNQTWPLIVVNEGLVSEY